MLRFTLIASALLICACNRPEKPAAPTQTATAPATPPPAIAADPRPAIVCFGDSITAGFGLDTGQSFPDLLQQDLDRRALKYRVVNLGVSGDTTQDGLARVSTALAEKPAIVLLELGGNRRGGGFGGARRGLRFGLLWGCLPLAATAQQRNRGDQTESEHLNAIIKA